MDSRERAALDRHITGNYGEDQFDDEDEEDEEEFEDDGDDGWAMPPFDEKSRLRVMAEMCSTCIFRPGNEMDLRPGRVASMLADIRARDSFIICHQTLGTEQPGAICKGGSEAHMSQLERIARRMSGMLVEVRPEEVKE